MTEQEYAKTMASEALGVLRHVMLSEHEAAETRVAAAKEILSRAYGKLLSADVCEQALHIAVRDDKE